MIHRAWLAAAVLLLAAGCSTTKEPAGAAGNDAPKGNAAPAGKSAPAGNAAPAAKPVQREVGFATEDGCKVAGTLHLPVERPVGAVLCLHQYMSARESFDAVVPLLVSKSLAVLAIDLRGHGKSGTQQDSDKVQGRDPALFAAMAADVAGAVNLLRAEPGLKDVPLGILGASVGSGLALQYAAQHEEVKALCLLSPGDYLGVPASESALKVHCRVLMTSEDAATADPVYTSLFRAGKVPEYLQEGVGEAARPIKHHGTDQFGQGYGIEEKLAEFFAAMKG
ncbi:MAG: alpha/beta fold hydrolase [Planctomycetes bacterium]|nr:alpha/beta fold hydrolase [Planctomycetota bacterium]